MESQFNVEVLTPTKKLLTTKATEALLPAYDGEVGILPGHEEFVGLLGTGPMKIVRDGDDYWFVVSNGVFQFHDNTLTLVTESGEDSQSIDIDAVRARIAELEPQVTAPDGQQRPDYERQRTELMRLKGKAEVYRRTSVVN